VSAEKMMLRARFHVLLSASLFLSLSNDPSLFTSSPFVRSLSLFFNWQKSSLNANLQLKWTSELGRVLAAEKKQKKLYPSFWCFQIETFSACLWPVFYSELFLRHVMRRSFTVLQST
jgi:hypothetical protein